MKRKVVFLASPAVWQRGHGPNHPLKPERLRRTYELLEEYGALDASNVRVVAPRPATDEELALFHTPEYIDVVRSLSSGDTTIPAGRFGFGPGDNPVFEGMFETEGLKVGSAVQAAELLVHGECDVAFSYSGGLHHGGPDFASGFCVFNDAAVAIHWLLRRGLRVAYVDIDVHHGDGVQDAFYDSDQVLTISLHQDGRTLFPGTGFVHQTGTAAGAGQSVNVPLPPYTDDDAYLWAFEQIVPPLLDRFQPDIVVTQLGVDTHYKDPLAQLALTTRGQATLFATLRDLAPRWLALGGGGYDISVVPRAWALAFAMMSQQSLPDELPPAYQARYGSQQLHDGEELYWASQSGWRETVQAVVAAVKRQHDLK
ncbi:MAG TPA: acetoin utilization protein AcuC [Anaerolineae bacterium]